MSCKDSLLPVYRRADICMVRGEGAYLFDDTGKKYLDFASGIAVNLLGHSHPKLVSALVEQAQKLWHCSNLYHNQELDKFADLLTQNCFADKVFFCSSGTEAVETVIKMIRHYHFAQGNKERTEIIIAENAFHGRTLGALSACGNAPSREGFGELLTGFVTVKFHDINSLKAAINQKTAGILLETIQGEGGVRAHSDEYLHTARALADEQGILLALDEVQCGYGRTGELFAFEKAGIIPDLLACAKGIGGGFPLGAALATNKAASGMKMGTHGSTYGGNPLAMAVGQAVLHEIMQADFLPQVSRLGEKFLAELEKLAKDLPHIFVEARGRGLMLALVLQNPQNRFQITEVLREAGLLVAPATSGILRILPPLNISNSHIDEAITILRQL